MSTHGCPACDLSDAALPPFEALALGVGVGLAKKDMHAVTESMCSARGYGLIRVSF